MLDKPEKTFELMNILDAAPPFEVALMPDLIENLARQQKPVALKPIETASEISYLGEVGGIVCHIQPEDARGLAYPRARAPHAPLRGGHARLSEASGEKTSQAAISRLTSCCVYRKPKSAHSGDEVRQGLRVN
jgi:hypothetical protein